MKMNLLIYEDKIAIATGSRAEYGLLKKLIKLIDKSNLFDLQLLVTGSHLSKNMD